MGGGVSPTHQTLSDDEHRRAHIQQHVLDIQTVMMTHHDHGPYHAMKSSGRTAWDNKPFLVTNRITDAVEKGAVV